MSREHKQNDDDHSRTPADAKHHLRALETFIHTHVHITKCMQNQMSHDTPIRAPVDAERAYNNGTE